MGHRDSGVSEIVGTLLVFAIVVSAFSAFELWYVPNTQTSYEQQFQASSQTALASLISQLDNPSLTSGQVISQHIPLGIRGSIFAPSTPTSLSYQSSGVSSSLNYQVGVNYMLLKNTVPTAITNEVIGTSPAISGKAPSGLVQVGNDIYVTDFASNSVSEISASSHKLIGSYSAGLQPVGITAANNGYLYVSNFQAYYIYNNSLGGSYYYSTITVFNPYTNSIVKTVNINGSNQYLLYPSGITFVPFNSNFGYIYVSCVYGSPGSYNPEISIINTSNNKVVGHVILSNLPSAQYPWESNIVAYSYGGYEYVWSTDYYQNNVTILKIPESSGSEYSNPPPPKNINFDILNPFGIAYDPINNNVYISDSPYLFTPSGTPHGQNLVKRGQTQNGNVTVYNATAVFVKKIPVPVPLPAGIAVPPPTAENLNVYVSGYNVSYNISRQNTYSQILAINSSNDFCVSKSFNFNATLKFIEGPISMLYVNGSGLNELAIVDYMTSNTVFLQNPANTILASYTWNNIYNSPADVAYLNGTNLIAVLNSASNNVAIINTMNQSTSLLNVGTDPVSLAYDPSNGFLFVANSMSSNITVLNPVAHKSVANINLTGKNPSFVAYDSYNGSVYALDYSSTNLTQVVQKGSSDTFTTDNFSFATAPPPPPNYGIFSEVNATSANIATYNLPEAEQFNVGSTSQSINYVVLYLSGSGSVQFGIGTSLWGDNVVPFTTVNVNSNTLWYNTSIPAVTLTGGTNYYLTVEGSGNIQWGYTSSPSVDVGATQDYWYFFPPSNGMPPGTFLVNDNSIPDIYTIGYGSGGSSNLPHPDAAAIIPSSNTMYIAENGTSTLVKVNLSQPGKGAVAQHTVGFQPDSVAYDPFNNTLYVANYGSSNVSVLTPALTPITSFSVGAGAHPTALVMDYSNRYLYVCNDGKNNITLDNTLTSQVINSIATGSGPISLAWDPSNGIIYVADQFSNQVTEINGGSIYFHATPGTLIHSSLSGYGQIVSAGYTHFVTPIVYHVQDGLVLTNYSSLKYVTSSANVPVSVVKGSSGTFLSSYLLNIAGSSSSTSGIGTNTLLLRVSNLSVIHLYDGEHFTYMDLYNNPYPAMVTGVYLSGFNYSISSRYASEIDQILYNQYNGSSSGNMNSWNFSGFQFHVTLSPSGDNLLISSDKQIYLYSINFEYLSVKVLSI